MSHVTGTVQTANVTVGPQGGGRATSPGVWQHDFVAAPAPAPGTRFVILHFHDVNLPAANRLEVELGYDTDVFTGTSGAAFWTRPINAAAFPGGIPIRYITSGSNQGRARIDMYGRGERMAGHQDPSALSNCDPFLLDNPYTEPIYDPHWFCAPPNPRWEDLRCAPAGDIRRTTGAATGMIVTVHVDDAGHGPHVSTCSGTLIGPDLFITAGHCFNTDAEVLASSVVFDNETECGGGRPSPYGPRFHKVVRVMARKWNPSVSLHDYALMQLAPATGGIGVTPAPLRSGMPSVGEAIFGVHHPNGAVKKLSPVHTNSATVASTSATHINVNLDVAGGSSGSGLFDLQGRYLGILSHGPKCSLNYFPMTAVNQELANPTTPPATRDVMIVIDRSGSMSEPAGTGRTKMQEARDAASLFVQLVRAGTGNRTGLVSFSSAASSPVDFALAPTDPAAKASLVGPAPYTGGIVGGLTPGGATSIGAGLEAARLQLAAGGSNPRAILLLTDGMQNTPPLIQTVEPALGDTEVHAVGFGEAWGLDGTLLTQLAQRHHGLYTRAGTGLHLKKFFAMAFGNIFESGTLLDPQTVVPEGGTAAKDIGFDVCDEDAITVVLGWERPEQRLRMEIRTPAGDAVDPASVEVDAGATWAFARVALPHAGAREGRWSVTVARDDQRFERSEQRLPEVAFFVSVIPDGGPRLKRLSADRTYYTGDTINPLVALVHGDGSRVPHPEVALTVSGPERTAGDALAEHGIEAPDERDEDTIGARQATLAKLAAGGWSPGLKESQVDLLDEREHNGGFFEAVGVFGRELDDVLTAEGDYTLHVRAGYGHGGCAGTRELVWSVHVDVGIDPGRSDVQVDRGPDGRVTTTITPRDRFGHLLGPGRAGDIEVSALPGDHLDGGVVDNGDGTYTATGHGSGGGGLVVTQPGREPVVLTPAGGGGTTGTVDRCRWWRILALVLAVLVLVLVVVLIAS